MSDLQSTPIQSLNGQGQGQGQGHGQGELVDNVEQTYKQMNSEEEGDINDTMYGHQMDGNINESFTQQDHVSQNVQPPKTMVARLVNTLKAPVIVLVLFILLNLQMIKTMSLTLLGKVINPENALIGSGDVIARGLICALLFFVINKFV
jgi:hypothetical protein